MKTLLAWLLLAGTAAAQALPPSPQGLTAQYSAACAASTCATWNVGTATSVTVSVTGAGSWTGTFYGSSDGGNTYFTVSMIRLSDRTTTSTVTDTGDGQYAIVNSGLTHLQFRLTTWASGGANVWAIRGYGSPMAIPFSSGGGPLLVNDGTCAAPSYSFLSDPTQGLALGCLVLKQGTITADAQALSTTATWNNAAITFTHWKAVITDTASGAGSLAVNILGGAAGSTTLFSLSKAGLATFGSQINAGGTITVPSSGGFQFSSRGYLSATADGVFSLNNAAGTDFSRLQFGGTTSAFVAAKRVGAALYLRLADDSAAGGLGFASLAVSGTAPTIASGGCTSPAVTWSNGTAAFLITIGTSCTGVKTFTLTMPAATNLWAVDCTNNTSDAAQQTNFATARATSTTAVVVTSYDRTTSLQEDFTAGNTYLCKASGG